MGQVSEIASSARLIVAAVKCSEEVFRTERKGFGQRGDEGSESIYLCYPNGE